MSGPRPSNLEALPVPVVTTSLDDDAILYANREFERLVGIPEGLAVSRTLDDVFGAPGCHALIVASVAGGDDPGRVELPSPRPDGSVLWVVGTVRRTEGEQGAELLCAFRDASQRRQWEAELVELAELPEMNPGPVCRLDAAGEVMLANSAARRLFPLDELLGRSWLDVCPGLTGDVWEQVRESDEPYVHEAEIADHVFQFTHVRSDSGDSVFAFGADITSRRDAERQLAEVARFPDMNPGPVIRTDTDGNVLIDNKAARAVLGESLKGRCWVDICPGLDRSRWDEILAAAEPVPIDARIGDREYLFTHRPDPEMQLVFVFGADVTNQRRAEQALRQSEKMATLGTLVAGVAHELNNPAAATSRAAQHLHDAFGELEQARLRLDRVSLDQAGSAVLAEIESTAREQAGQTSELDPLDRSDLESEIETWLEERGIEDAWELAPPLVGLGLDPAGLERLAATLDEEALVAALVWAARIVPVYALLYEIGEGSTRISQIVGALKSYSFLGQAPVQTVDLHEGLDNTLVILRSKLKHGVTVKRDYCSDLPLVEAYGSELNQVWTNLIDNAVDAMDGEGVITIRTRSENGWAVVEIEDDGPGIPEDVQAQVFDPFFTTKDPGKGTGLGLSTSYSVITEKHGGRLEVESRPGSTRFTIRLPSDGPAQS